MCCRRRKIDMAEKCKGVQPIFQDRRPNTETKGLGPRQVIVKLSETLLTERHKQHWLEEAEIDAMLGGAPKSLGKLKSALRCYVAFVDYMHTQQQGAYLPPTLNTLLTWSATFRSEGTFGQYLSHLKCATMLAKQGTTVFDHDALKRARQSIKKRG